MGCETGACVAEKWGWVENSSTTLFFYCVFFRRMEKVTMNFTQGDEALTPE